MSTLNEQVEEALNLYHNGLKQPSWADCDECHRNTTYPHTEGKCARCFAEHIRTLHNDYFKALVQGAALSPDEIWTTAFEGGPQDERGIGEHERVAEKQRAAILSQLDSPTTEYVRVPDEDSLRVWLGGYAFLTSEGVKPMAHDLHAMLKGQR